MQACLNEHAFCKKIALCVHISSTWVVQTLFALTGKNGQNLRAWTTVLTTKFRSWNFLPSRKNDRRAREPNFPLKLTRFKAFISFHCLCVTTFDVLSTLYSVFVYIWYFVTCPSSTDYTQKLAAPQCLHYQNGETFCKKWHPLQRINIGMTTFYYRMSRHFDSVNTGELPTSECNQWMTGMLQYIKCKQKRSRMYLKHRKLWRKINLLS